MSDYPGRDLHQEALSLFGSGRAAEALDAFDRALALSPDQAAIHYDRAASLWALERGAEAARHTRWRRCRCLKDARSARAPAPCHRAHRTTWASTEHCQACPSLPSC